MGSELVKKERLLDELEVDDEIESKRVSIAQKKAVEREMKRKYGRDWKKVLGLVGKLKPNREAIQDLYSFNPELKELNRPVGFRKL